MPLTYSSTENPRVSFEILPSRFTHLSCLYIMQNAHICIYVARFTSLRLAKFRRVIHPRLQRQSTPGTTPNLVTIRVIKSTLYVIRVVHIYFFNLFAPTGGIRSYAQKKEVC